MPLKMSKWEDPQLRQTWQKLFWRARTEEELLVTWQALPPLRTRDCEWLWEYSYPTPFYTLSYQRAIKWLDFIAKRRHEEKSLRPPPSLPGPPPSVHNILGAALAGVRFEEEEEDAEESPCGREQQETERELVTDNMNVDSPQLQLITITPQPLMFGLSTPAPPPTASTTPHLSAEDPIGDTLTTIFQHMTGQERIPQEGTDHTPLTSKGWYEFRPGDAHVWMDIPPSPPDPDNEEKRVPARYLKATIRDGTPILQGCQGRGNNIYSEILCTHPFHAAGTRFLSFDTTLEALEDPLDPRIERSLLFLGDLGVLADVYVLRTIPLRREGLLRRKEDVLTDLNIMGKRPQPAPLSSAAIDFHRLLERLISIQRLESKVNTLEMDVRHRLKAARALLRISPYLKMDKEGGEVPSSRLFLHLVSKRAKADLWIQANRGGPRRRVGVPGDMGAQRLRV
jgi:hypothetical protein